METNAAETLDIIRHGGTCLVTLSIARLEEARQALQDGRFDKALTRCQEAQGVLQQLASAQTTLGIYGRNVILVRANELTEGMDICQVGVVAQRSIESATLVNSFDLAEIVSIKLVDSDQIVQFEGDKQLLVWVT